MSTSVIPLVKPLQSWSAVSHEYQHRAIKLMVSQACAGLFMEPGLGKTSTTLAAFKILHAKKLVKKMLVIVPLKPMYNSWPGEIDKWTEFADLKYAFLHGPDKEDMLESDADIFLINPEGLKWLFSAQKAGSKVLLDFYRLARTGVDMLIVDESTRFKDSQSQRFKMLRQVVKKFSRRYILTGTPSPNGLMDLFGQIYILDEGASLGAYITHFRNHYFYPDHTGFNWLPIRGADEMIAKQIAPLVLRMAADDYLELPELVQNKVMVDLPPPARKMYNQMEDALIVQLKNENIVAANEAVASGKCRQIASGCLYSTDVLGQRSYEVLHTEKIEALTNLVEELSGQPLLVFYEYQFEREMLEETLAPLNFRLLGKSPKHDKEYIDAFNRGELGGLIAQTSSASLGLNLQAACANVCFYTCTWRHEDHKQGIDRVRRQGNPNLRVIVHYLLARDTIDEVVFARVHKKGRDERNLGSILEALRNERERG